MAAERNFVAPGAAKAGGDFSRARTEGLGRVFGFVSGIITLAVNHEKLGAPGRAQLLVVDSERYNAADEPEHSAEPFSTRAREIATGLRRPGSHEVAFGRHWRGEGVVTLTLTHARRSQRTGAISVRGTKAASPHRALFKGPYRPTRGASCLCGSARGRGPPMDCWYPRAFLAFLRRRLRL